MATIKSLVKRKVILKPKAAAECAAPSDWVLIDKHDRSKLSEGRKQGMGFAIAAREDKTVTLIDSLTCCKDFLSDRCYVQHKGGSYSIYGMTCKKVESLFGNAAHLVIGILNTNRCTVKYLTHDKDVAALASNTAHIQAALNFVEEAMGLASRTVIERVADNRYLVTFDPYWASATYLISLFTLLLRASLYYTGGDPIAYWTALESEDVYMLRAALPKLKRLMEGERPAQDFAKLSAPHNMGIVSFPFPPKVAAPIS